jgi:hypothetical protein
MGIECLSTTHELWLDVKDLQGRGRWAAPLRRSIIAGTDLSMWSLARRPAFS